MPEAIKPDNDAARVAALCGMRLLDSPREERFDRITRTAQRVFDVPIVLISLVDDGRQWFKSRVGMQRTETSRAESFCGHAILTADALVVPDALADARFADNPLVTGPEHLRFYAGMPLKGTDGHLIGTLCLLDRVARQFGPADVAALGDLASWAEIELNLQSVSEANAVSREKEARLRAIVDHAGDGIITIDQRGRIESFNPAAAIMFGYMPLQVIGEDFRRLMTEDFHHEAERFLERFSDGTTLGNSRLSFEMMGLREDGTAFPAELVVSEMRLGGRRGFNGIVRDLTERKRIEQMKTEFVANVSHELRTPVTSIRGALGLLASGTLGDMAPPAKALLDIAYSNCERLVRLVNDILDIEKIESGNMRFEFVAQPLLPLVQQAIGSTSHYAGQYDVTLRLAADAEDATVSIDADRMIQVVVNLLSNAVKFSPPGGIVTIDLQRLPAGHNGHAAPANRIRLTVADHGGGIPEAFRSRVFQKFAQADNTDSREKSGTGLGLSISRTIVERHGGVIGFVSSDAGSVFHVELPLAPAADGPQGHDGAA